MIVCVTGMPGSGKSVMSEIAEELNFEVIKMGRIFINEICSKYDIKPTETKKIRIHMTKIREKEGQEIVAKYTLSKIKESNSKNIFIEGVRNIQEIEFFRENLKDVKLISLWSETRNRMDRSLKRTKERLANEGDAEKTEEDLRFRDLQEVKTGVPVVMTMADYTIVNQGDYETFISECRNILNELMK